MEQNAGAGVPVAPMVDNKQKSGNGLKIATAIACVVAACGIGFGVYGMMQSSQKDSQISDLKVQIKEDDGTITTIETPEIETATNNGTTITITDPTMSKEKTKDYIYIGEWGVRIKIPENLKGISYIYDNHSRLSLCVNGIANGGQYAPDFADIHKNTDGLGCIAQYFDSELTEEQKQTASFSNGEFYLVYSHPQAVYSIDKSEQNWEVDSVNLIQEMLTKNISAF
ncbi:MAG: hypothetical protein IKG26_04540 [Bacillus sp. (in: Bacteria)]|nr:hypothetical protein [Candidatus Saccharibacteria bacterium]MBR3122284.1 hypothetical protein [Candidatus Saccharibacteria bacterium]MBR3336277.1 hypothetical protein [Bacillus sp. (in: firmicutes)]